MRHRDMKRCKIWVLKNSEKEKMNPGRIRCNLACYLLYQGHAEDSILIQKIYEICRQEQVVVGIGSSRCTVFLFSLALKRLRIQTIGCGISSPPRIVFNCIVKRFQQIL